MGTTLKMTELAFGSARFVRDNLNVLKKHLAVIFPLLMVLQVAVLSGDALQKEWIGLIALVPSVYLYACFALSWHRTSLRGPDEGHAVNPFSIKDEDKNFIAWFFAFFLVPFVAGALMGLLFGLMAVAGMQWLTALTGIAVIVGFIVLLVLMIRLSFVLPARSVNAAIPVREVFKASKGLVLKIIGAGFLISLLFLAALFIYGLIVALIVGVMTSDAVIGVPMTVFISFLFGLPVQIGMMVVTAINITILSRAYQWGMQNNPVV